MPVVGVGLRTAHYDDWLTEPPRRGGFCEALTENFLGRGGRPRAVLERVRAEMDIFLHGVSLSIGGTDPLDEVYIASLQALVEQVEPRFVSDHACFAGAAGVRGHDLYPLPLTDETLKHVVGRIQHVQERLRRPIAIENVSSYLRFTHDTLAESDFLRELAERSGALLLVDVNNVVVSAHNHGFSARDYMAALPRARVAYLHVAGHSRRAGYRFDDHASAPDDEVESMLGLAFELYGDVPCIFEWDEAVPSLAEYVTVASSIAARTAPSRVDTGAK